MQMGQYAYLINKEKRISCEAHKISEGGENSGNIESPEPLGRFFEYCRKNNLRIECVSEHWFSENIDLEIEEPFTEFSW